MIPRAIMAIPQMIGLICFMFYTPLEQLYHLLVEKKELSVKKEPSVKKELSAFGF